MIAGDMSSDVGAAGALPPNSPPSSACIGCDSRKRAMR